MRGGDADPAATHVAVYETRRLLRQSLSIWLSGQDDIKVVGYAASINAVAQLCDQAQADVLVMGLGNDHERLLREAQAISRRFTKVRLIAITDGADDKESERILSHGFRAVVPTSAGVTNLLRVIRAGTTTRTIRRPLQAPVEEGPLTPRETEVLSLVGQGSKVQDISVQLGISQSTVTSHKERIFTKLEANNQAHAVARAVQLGIINPARDEDPHKAS